MIHILTPPAAHANPGTWGPCEQQTAARLELLEALPVRLAESDLEKIRLLVTRRYGARAREHASPRAGVNRRVYDRYLAECGWTWTPTMQVGQGCRVHLRSEELPPGRLIARVSRHMCAVIDGVVHDIADPSRAGARCVYGYWQPPSDG